MLNLKRVLTKLCAQVTPVKTTFTPTSGSAYASYGGCFYEQMGSLVRVHLAISGLTADTNTTVYQMPTGLRPKEVTVGSGFGNGLSATSTAQIGTSGTIQVRSSTTTCNVDIYYII